MRAGGHLYFLIFFMVTSLVAVIISLSFDYIEAKLLPLLTSSVMLILAATELTRELFKGRLQADKEAEVFSKVKALREMRQFGLALGWVIGLLLGVYVVGFLVAIPFFALSYLKVRGRDWRTSVSFSVILTIAVYLIFELGLRANLFKGLIFYWAGPSRYW